MSEEPEDDGWLADQAREALSTIAALHADAVTVIRDEDVPSKEEPAKAQS
ncbi:hypothetical protein [Amycolatopsis sp. GM8]|nr:hypothetical protein [Amycolatopsis sp. GM8]